MATKLKSKFVFLWGFFWWAIFKWFFLKKENIQIGGKDPKMD